MNLEPAVAYSQKHAQEALIVRRGVKSLLEIYGNGMHAESAHALYSGTKSFWGAAALAAQDDGILALDEPVARLVSEWQGDAAKSRITARMLLQMTAGFGFGGLGSAVPTYDRALAAPLRNAAGTVFTYGGVPLQIFGAYFARALSTRRQTPHEYLRERVLVPAKVTIASWRSLKDGTNPLPTGAMLTARAWASYGAYINANRDRFAAAFVGSTANPRYGLGWWLAPDGAPPDLVYASGSGGQALYLVPSLDLVVARFGKSASFKHEAFLKRLLS